MISICYGTIIQKSKSLDGTVEQRNQGNIRTQENREKKSQRSIAMVISTDFVCWVPFIIVCGLHSLELINATPTYSIFSLLVLPINAVINPLLYSDFFGKHITIRIAWLNGKFQTMYSGFVRRNVMTDLAVNRAEEIELNIIANRIPQQLTSQSPPKQLMIPRIVITEANTVEEIINANLIGYRDYN